MTSFVFRETLMAHLLIYGNAYAQIIRNGRCEVLGLYPLMPDMVRVDRGDHDRLIYRYSRYDEHNPNFRQQGYLLSVQRRNVIKCLCSSGSLISIHMSKVQYN